jgi:hypothetical protein
VRDLSREELQFVGGGTATSTVEEVRWVSVDGVDRTNEVITIIGQPWAAAANGGVLGSLVGAGTFYFATIGGTGLTANGLLAAWGLGGIVGSLLGVVGWSLAGIYVTARDSGPVPSGDPNVVYP